MSMQISNDTIGNRTHDLLACGAVSEVFNQPTSQPTNWTTEYVEQTKESQN